MTIFSKINLNLQSKMMLLFIVLALVPLSTIGIVSIQNTEKLIFDMVMRQLENVAIDKASILENWLEERKADLNVIGGTSILKSMEPGVIGPYLDLVQKEYMVYKNFTVFSERGDIVFSTDGGAFPGAFHKSRMMHAPLHVSSIINLPREKESAFHIAAPISDAEGKSIGSVYGTVGTNKIIFGILNVSLGKSGECYLVDKEGTFLAHKEPARILKENISKSESFKNIFQKSDRKKFYLDYRGIEVLGTSAKIEGTDWFLVVEQDREEAFQSLQALKRNIYFTILLFILSALTLTWFVFRHIVKPIRALSRSADMLSSSEFDAAVFKTARQDEIGTLYRAFENMTVKLRERQNHLEHEVDIKEAELKETGMILKQTKAAAERSEKFAAIGRLGAAVAHEIRTPITSLKLFLESVREEIEISAESREDFDVAMGQIRRIEGTINRFLDFSKPQELVCAEVDIPRLIQDVLLMAKPMINKNECTLDVRLEKDLPVIEGDRKFLSETLINLLVNALEAMTDDRHLFISAQKDRFASNGETFPCIRIDVKDTGAGIPDHQIVSIFEPFFTTKSSGTGLGLPLALNTIRRHGGDIRVLSGIDAGTVFSLFLPIKSRFSFGDDGKNIAHR